MTRAVVDKFSDIVKGMHSPPTTFPINGNYIIELPENFDPTALVSPASALITAKENAYLFLNPPFSTVNSDEFLTTAGVDTGASDQFTIGDQKGTRVESGGTLFTTTTIVPGTANYFVHVDLFNIFNVKDISSTLPSRIKLNYNFDGTMPVEIDPLTAATISLDDGGVAGFTVITPDTPFTAPSGGSPTEITLSIAPTGPGFYISSWVVLTD